MIVDDTLNHGDGSSKTDASEAADTNIYENCANCDCVHSLPPPLVKKIIVVISRKVGFSRCLTAKRLAITNLLQIVKAAENNVREEQIGISRNISELTKRRAEISEAIAEKTLKINDYRTNLQRYRDYTKLQSGIDFVNEQLQVLGRKKVSELHKKKNPPLYHAKKRV